MMKLLELLLCRHRVGKTSEDVLATKPVPTTATSASQRMAGPNAHSSFKASAASGALRKPHILHIGGDPLFPLLGVEVPFSVVALDTVEVLLADDLDLSAMLEVVYISPAVTTRLGASTCQAYERLILHELLNSEQQLLLELRDTVMSLHAAEQEATTAAAAAAARAAAVAGGDGGGGHGASPPSAAGAAVTAAATTAAAAATAAASAGRKLHTPLLAVASMTTGLVGGVPPVTRASRSQVHQGGGGGGVRGQHDEEGVDGDFRPSGLPQRIGSASSHGSEDSESARPCGPGTHGSAAVAELGLEGLRLHPAWIIGGPCRSGALVERRPGVVLWHRQPLSWRHSRAVALRSLGLLSHLDAAVTLVACSGRVVYQNAASRRFYGRLLGRPPREGPSPMLGGGISPLPMPGQGSGVEPGLAGHPQDGQQPHQNTQQLHSRQQRRKGPGGGVDDDDDRLSEGGPPLRRALTVLEPRAGTGGLGGMGQPGAWAGDLESLLRGMGAAHVVRRLFSCDLPRTAEDMLAAWASGRQWKRLLHVPPPAAGLLLPGGFSVRRAAPDAADMSCGGPLPPGFTTAMTRGLPNTNSFKNRGGGGWSFGQGHGGGVGRSSGPASQALLWQPPPLTTRLGLGAAGVRIGDHAESGGGLGGLAADSTAAGANYGSSKTSAVALFNARTSADNVSKHQSAAPPLQLLRQQQQQPAQGLNHQQAAPLTPSQPEAGPGADTDVEATDAASAFTSSASGVKGATTLTPINVEATAGSPAAARSLPSARRILAAADSSPGSFTAPVASSATGAAVAAAPTAFATAAAATAARLAGPYASGGSSTGGGTMFPPIYLAQDSYLTSPSASSPSVTVSVSPSPLDGRTARQLAQWAARGQQPAAESSVRSGLSAATSMPAPPAEAATAAAEDEPEADMETDSTGPEAKAATAVVVPVSQSRAADEALAAMAARASVAGVSTFDSYAACSARQAITAGAGDDDEDLELSFLCSVPIVPPTITSPVTPPTTGTPSTGGGGGGATPAGNTVALGPTAARRADTSHVAAVLTFGRFTADAAASLSNAGRESRTGPSPFTAGAADRGTPSTVMSSMMNTSAMNAATTPGPGGSVPNLLSGASSTAASTTAAAAAAAVAAGGSTTPSVNRTSRPAAISGLLEQLRRGPPGRAAAAVATAAVAAEEEALVCRSHSLDAAHMRLHRLARLGGAVAGGGVGSVAGGAASLLGAGAPGISGHGGPGSGTVRQLRRVVSRGGGGGVASGIYDSHSLLMVSRQDGEWMAADNEASDYRTAGSEIEDALQCSAWRASLKVSVSRRNLEAVLASPRVVAMGAANEAGSGTDWAGNGGSGGSESNSRNMMPRQFSRSNLGGPRYAPAATASVSGSLGHTLNYLGAPSSSQQLPTAGSATLAPSSSLMLPASNTLRPNSTLDLGAGGGGGGTGVLLEGGADSPRGSLGMRMSLAGINTSSGRPGSGSMLSMHRTRTPRRSSMETAIALVASVSNRSFSQSMAGMAMGGAAAANGAGVTAPLHRRVDPRSAVTSSLPQLGAPGLPTSYSLAISRGTHTGVYGGASMASAVTAPLPIARQLTSDLQVAGGSVLRVQGVSGISGGAPAGAADCMPAGVSAGSYKDSLELSMGNYHSSGMVVGGNLPSDPNISASGPGRLLCRSPSGPAGGLSGPVASVGAALSGDGEGVVGSEGGSMVQVALVQSVALAGLEARHGLPPQNVGITVAATATGGPGQAQARVEAQAQPVSAGDDGDETVSGSQLLATDGSATGGQPARVPVGDSGRVARTLHNSVADSGSRLFPTLPSVSSSTASIRGAFAAGRGYGFGTTGEGLAMMSNGSTGGGAAGGGPQSSTGLVGGGTGSDAVLVHSRRRSGSSRPVSASITLRQAASIALAALSGADADDFAMTSAPGGVGGAAGSSRAGGAGSGQASRLAASQRATEPGVVMSSGAGGAALMAARTSGGSVYDELEDSGGGGGGDGAGHPGHNDMQLGTRDAASLMAALDAGSGRGAGGLPRDTAAPTAGGAGPVWGSAVMPQQQQQQQVLGFAQQSHSHAPLERVREEGSEEHDMVMELVEAAGRTEGGHLRQLTAPRVVQQPAIQQQHHQQQQQQHHHHHQQQVAAAMQAALFGGYEEHMLKWHEVSASPFLDPVTGQRMLLLVQTDVTARVEAERKLVELTAAQTGMLEQMFPRHVLEFMVEHGEFAGNMDFSNHLSDFAHAHDLVTVLFTDIVGFTTMSKMVPAAAVMMFLSDLYSKLDALVDEFGVWKVETAGDCYIVAGGVVRHDQDGFAAVVTGGGSTSEAQYMSQQQQHPQCQAQQPQQQQLLLPVSQGSGSMTQQQMRPGSRPNSSTSLPHPGATTASRGDAGAVGAATGGNAAGTGPAALLIDTADGATLLNPMMDSTAGLAGNTGSGNATGGAGRTLLGSSTGYNTLGTQPAPISAAAAAAAAAAGAGAGSRLGDTYADAAAVFEFAVAMLEAARTVRMPHNGEPVQLRVGIHSGPLVSGVIGTKMPKFALFGDTMNTASRMESTCRPGMIQVSETTRALLPHVTTLLPTGGVHVKGKGLMNTFIYSPPPPLPSQPSAVMPPASPFFQPHQHLNPSHNHHHHQHSDRTYHQGYSHGHGAVAPPGHQPSPRGRLATSATAAQAQILQQAQQQMQQAAATETLAAGGTSRGGSAMAPAAAHDRKAVLQQQGRAGAAGAASAGNVSKEAAARAL